MKNNFWIEDISPKQMFSELLKEDHSITSFWDIFTSYKPQYIEPANTSEKWLSIQSLAVEDIANKYFLNREITSKKMELELESAIGAINEFTLPKEMQNLEYLDPKWLKIGKEIAETYILPHKLNDTTILSFLDELEKRVLYKDLDYIEDKSDDDLNSSEHDVNEEVLIDDFIYPRFPLAYSATFFGFGENDCGHLSYEEIDLEVQCKFNQYKTELNELLNQQSSKNLQPKKPEEYNDQFWGKNFEFTEKYPFAMLFSMEFRIWQKENKVLFLYANREDKELPYEIGIGGLSLEKYKQIVKQYNEYIQKK